MTGHEPPVEIDTSKPHPARMYDWFLGGKDNYPIDEQMARQLLAVDARGRDMARVNRAFMHRATRWLAENGIRQFLDIGAGIPTEPNLHQIAQQTAPDARIVYCDNDPIVLAHAAALLRSTPEGATEYIQADARKPEVILEAAGKVLDFDRPIALSLLALLHFLDDEDGAAELVDRLVDQLAPGSYLILSQTTGDFDPEGAAEAAAMYKARGMTLRPRSRAELTAFFHGLELVDPGVSLSADWHPELGEVIDVPGDEPIPGYAGVARKG
ncbi:SAM-dependent methyltransferase [Streptomyces poriferorum]|uniref:SAM-dependent methyltransferase n=1 Tax=Streptomyces poriferorum TaxID=2798799 RepID=A0ABY9II06_9ACTN|nr:MULTISPECIES: SAM-dependent methyltransferase [Streptomyces]MBW5248027.1 SAM-dependent methyltransferase [Streptomyces poriferorum]MBW5255843.1 SAM-dependent methyltransferase [Streptomyces poriferorum]MDP5316569.1 SAM-dependent methyltransferase [Streptomyces sp. Alt4]WLQ52361.1 SAM-dependent methyltransferase [Streptomyces sp. Alt1]WLQ54875.1 SAM-dependent methyltransferase [Streptomyces sp. Alt2]